MNLIQELRLSFDRTDKTVICFRCLNVYHLNQAVYVKTKGLKHKERACPKCESKVYFS